MFENAQERMAAGRPVMDGFRPLAGEGELQDLVFPATSAAAGQDALAPRPNVAAGRLRPTQVGPEKAEKSVRIMAASSGGAARGQDVTNKWGKVANPPSRAQLQAQAGSGASSSGGPKQLTSGFKPVYD